MRYQKLETRPKNQVSGYAAYSSTMNILFPQFESFGDSSPRNVRPNPAFDGSKDSVDKLNYSVADSPIPKKTGYQY
jgi:hypothetical protein